MTTKEITKKIQLITRIGVSLHKYGANAQRLEASLITISTHLGLSGNFFSTPTYLMIAIDTDDEQINSHVRVTPGDTNLSSLQEVDALVDKLIKNEVSVDECLQRLAIIQSSPFHYLGIFQMMAYMFTSAALAIILQGGSTEAILSFLLSFIVGFLAWTKQFNIKLNEIYEFFCSFLVMLSCFILSKNGVQFNYQTVLISSLIVIIPGLGLTTAMNELATQNLASGTARLMGALIDLFKISFGILLGMEVGKMYFGEIEMSSSIPLSPYMMIFALVIASLSFTIIFNAKLRDFGYVLMSGIIALSSLYIAQTHMTQVLSIFIASFTVAFSSNLFARITNRPSAIMLVPGIIFLVPGSVGLKGLNLIFQNLYLEGLATGFQMFLIAITIVAGMFLANVMMNPKKTL